MGGCCCGVLVTGRYFGGSVVIVRWNCGGGGVGSGQGRRRDRPIGGTAGARAETMSDGWIKLEPSGRGRRRIACDKVLTALQPLISAHTSTARSMVGVLVRSGTWAVIESSCRGVKPPRDPLNRRSHGTIGGAHRTLTRIRTMAAQPGFKVGERIRSDASVATVRYVGSVASAKDQKAVYIGVVWDDPTRGERLPPPHEAFRPQRPPPPARRLPQSCRPPLHSATPAPT